MSYTLYMLHILIAGRAVVKEEAGAIHQCQNIRIEPRVPQTIAFTETGDSRKS